MPFNRRYLQTEYEHIDIFIPTSPETVRYSRRLDLRAVPDFLFRAMQD
jgi:predicted metalloenzyme YecM